MLESKDFDDWSGDYDQSVDLHSKNFPFIGYYDVLAAVQSLVEPTPELKVLDIGIGTGLLSRELYKKGCDIYGIDFSGKMLQKAQERMPKGKFCVANVAVEHFGNFNSDKYDRVISSYFFHHLDTKQKIDFCEKTLQNNLNPKGKIIIADVGFKTRKEFDEGYKTYEKYWDTDELYLCGEEIVDELQQKGMSSEYKQISKCAESCI